MKANFNFTFDISALQPWKKNPPILTELKNKRMNASLLFPQWIVAAYQLRASPQVGYVLMLRLARGERRAYNGHCIVTESSINQSISDPIVCHQRQLRR